MKLKRTQKVFHFWATLYMTMAVCSCICVSKFVYTWCMCYVTRYL